ncbi:MAG: DUF2959 family protein [Candidatus Methylomirabilales bacterium]
MARRGGLALAIAAVGLAAVIAGCAASGVERRQSVVSSMEDARSHVSRSRTQVAAATAALNGLPGKSGDALTAQYRQFVREYERLESLANDMGREAAAVRERGDRQLKAWQEEAAALQDPELRKRAEARRAEQAARYEAFATEAAQTERALYAFLGDLRDIRRYLDLDLTPQGVASVRDKIAAANRRADPVMQNLARLDERLTTLAATVQPGGTPAGTMAGAPAAGTSDDMPAVSQAQAQLKAAGFDPGSVSGVLNEQTQDALRRYQQAKGLPATGRLDEQTRAALQREQ